MVFLYVIDLDIFYTGGLLMQIHESAENYLETILMLSKKLPVVRSVDIANELDFKKSSAAFVSVL